MRLKHSVQTILGTLAAFSLWSCSSDSGSSSSPGSSSTKAESDYCSTVQSVSDPVTVTATAQFKARQIIATGLGSPGPATAIKYAEVQVTSSDGSLIQCAETDSSGGISLQIPKVAGTYRLTVNSRSNSAKVKASILNNPTENSLFSIYSDFTIDGSSASASVTLPVAAADSSTLEGGAFNILEQVYLANEFLRNNKGSSVDSSFVAPKIQIFWTPGLSPAAYWGEPSVALSFFLDEDDSDSGISRGLYIGGGTDGDVNCTDSDHFDNSIILHEYGHYLENIYSKSNSPGGSHNGNFVIDPRLAWSEGWANFVQAAIMGEYRYRDTIGNTDCSSGGTSFGVVMNLQTPTAGQDKMAAGTTSGEGVFREVSVARLLWDVWAPTGSGGINIGFPTIWSVFTGFASSNIHFRNIGHFNELLTAAVSGNATNASNLSTSISAEFQLADRTEYAQVRTPQTAGSGSCEKTMDPVGSMYSPIEDRQVSNLLKSNDFFAYYYNGSNPSITLKNASASLGSLTLHVYKENYVYDDATTRVATGTSVSLSGQPTGWYLINVRGLTDTSAVTYYMETSTGVRLCP